jgi:chorismate synthase
MEETDLEIKGRHDPCILPRAVPCMEAAAAAVLLDLMLLSGR